MHNYQPHLLYFIWWDNTKFSSKYTETCMQQTSHNIRVSRSFESIFSVVETPHCMSRSLNSQDLRMHTVGGLNGMDRCWEFRSYWRYWVELACSELLHAHYTLLSQSISWSPTKSPTPFLINKIQDKALMEVQSSTIGLCADGCSTYWTNKIMMSKLKLLSGNVVGSVSSRGWPYISERTSVQPLMYEDENISGFLSMSLK